MSYSSRRPRQVCPENTLFVPNALGVVSGPGSSVSSATLTANRGYYIPFSAPCDTAIKSISVWCVSGTTQNFDIGLYSVSGTRLGSLGSTGIASTTGLRTWTPASPISVAAWTTYLAAFACDSATPNWIVIAASGAQGTYGVSFAASQFALPATKATSSSASNVAVPLLKIVFSS